MYPPGRKQMKRIYSLKQSSDIHLVDNMSSSSNSVFKSQTKLSERTLRYHPYLGYPYYFKPKIKANNKCNPSSLSNIVKPIPTHAKHCSPSLNSDGSPYIDLESDDCSNNDSILTNTCDTTLIPEEIYSSDCTIHEVILIESASNSDSDDTVPCIASDLDDTLPMCSDKSSPNHSKNLDINLGLSCTRTEAQKSIIDESTNPDNVIASAKKSEVSSLIYSSSLVSRSNLKMKLKLIKQPITMDSETCIPFNQYFYGEVISGSRDLFKIPDYDTVLVNCPFCHDVLTNVTIITHYLKHFNFNIVKHQAKSQFSCPQCLKAFKSLCHLQSHINRHSVVRDDSARECLICESEFNSDLELALHFRNVQHPPQDTPYSCEICFNYRTSFFGNLWQHFTSVHEGEYCVICPYCLKYFEMLRLDMSRQCDLPPAFQYHIEKHVKGPNFSCSKCRLMFLKARGVTVHNSLHHTGKSVTYIDDEESAIKESSCSASESTNLIKFYYPRGSLKCAECKQTFTNPSRHFIKLFNCANCQYQTMCSVNIVRHLKHCSLHQSCSTLRPIRSHFHERVSKMVCPCNYVSHYGDEMARHMMACSFSYVTLSSCIPTFHSATTSKEGFLSFVSLLPT